MLSFQSPGVQYSQKTVFYITAVVCTNTKATTMTPIHTKNTANLVLKPNIGKIDVYRGRTDLYGFTFIFIIFVYCIYWGTIGLKNGKTRK